MSNKSSLLLCPTVLYIVHIHRFISTPIFIIMLDTGASTLYRRVKPHKQTGCQTSSTRLLPAWAARGETSAGASSTEIKGRYMYKSKATSSCSNVCLLACNFCLSLLSLAHLRTLVARYPSKFCKPEDKHGIMYMSMISRASVGHQVCMLSLLPVTSTTTSHRLRCWMSLISSSLFSHPLSLNLFSNYTLHVAVRKAGSQQESYLCEQKLGQGVAHGCCSCFSAFVSHYNPAQTISQAAEHKITIQLSNTHNRERALITHAFGEKDLVTSPLAASCSYSPP